MYYSVVARALTVVKSDFLPPHRSQPTPDEWSITSQPLHSHALAKRDVHTSARKQRMLTKGKDSLRELLE